MDKPFKSYLKLSLCFLGIFVLYLAGSIGAAMLSGGERSYAALGLLNALLFCAVTVVVYRKLFGGRIVVAKNARGLVFTAVYSALIIVVLDRVYRLHSLEYFAGHWASCLLFALASGCAEEFIFRGFLFDYISTRASVWVGILVISLLFGLLHVVNLLAGQDVHLLYLWNCMCAGFFLCVLYYEFGIAASLIYHVSWNMIFSDSTVEGKALTGVILLATEIAVLAVEARRRSVAGYAGAAASAQEEQGEA